MLKKALAITAMAALLSAPAFADSSAATPSTPAAPAAAAAPAMDSMTPAQKQHAKAKVKKHHKKHHHNASGKNNGQMARGSQQPASNGVPASGQQASNNPFGTPNPAH